MDRHEIYNLMYPIGKFEVPAVISKDHINEWKWTIEEFPTVIHGKIKNLTEAELKYRYRPNGWNITQVLHHLVDSHMNSLIRFKLAMTEDHPQIKPYHEGLWAKLPDYDPKLNMIAFNMLEGIHAKWYTLLSSLTEEDYTNKGFFHPETKELFSLGEALGMYDWHCRHHREHISQAISFEGRFPE